MRAQHPDLVDSWRGLFLRAGAVAAERLLSPALRSACPRTDPLLSLERVPLQTLSMRSDVLLLLDTQVCCLVGPLPVAVHCVVAFWCVRLGVVAQR